MGQDLITGFESVHGGQGNDHFVVASEAVSLTGGNGEDVFEFAAASGASAGSQVVHDILDFMVGDRIRISQYSIVKEVMDSLEDRFEDLYGNQIDKDELPIRIRHEQTDDLQQTFIDADFDQDDTYELSIAISGNHILMVVETA